MLHPARVGFRRALVAVLAAGVFLLSLPQAASAQVKKKGGKKSASRNEPQLPEFNTPADRLKFLDAIRDSMPTRRVASSIGYSSADLDKQLRIQIEAQPYEYAQVISDEQFIRRASLDLTGNVPDAAAVKKFVANSERNKRAALIDELLETKDYARKWARYWTSVIFHNTNANRKRINRQAMENWFAQQFEQNVRWDRIVAEMVSASPVRNKKNKDDWGQNYGPNNFVLACENKPDVIASNTARIFMGISIQCAECHDHPFDQWKREQFHELAAFFSPGRYYMPDQDDPTKKERMQAKFLLGEKPPENLNSGQRRVAVAAYLIYNPDNYWFARAFVNRVWSELVGDGFYSVDSLGPDAEVMHKIVVNRLAALFRYREFDPKWVFRILMNSDAYQREIRTIESDSKLFTAVRPARLRPGQVWSSVEKLTGSDRNLERAVTSTFEVDPSTPQRYLEGSLQQAFLLMNNVTLRNKLANSALKKQLMGIKSPQQMITELYLGVLARTPTEVEKQRMLAYMRQVPNRNESVDDMLWVLVNSTEFVTKR